MKADPALRYFLSRGGQAGIPEFRNNFLSTIYVQEINSVIYEFHLSDKFEPYCIVIAIVSVPIYYTLFIHISIKKMGLSSSQRGCERVLVVEVYHVLSGSVIFLHLSPSVIDRCFIESGSGRRKADRVIKESHRRPGAGLGDV